MNIKSQKVIKAAAVLVFSLLTSPVRAFALLIDLVANILPGDGTVDAATRQTTDDCRSGAIHTIGPGGNINPTAVSLTKGKDSQ